VAAAWVVPEPGGLCPTTHPVKAKLSSKLFHLPGMFAYTRTNPDRCYRDEAAAEADGLRKAKR
jgi:micrococcal nuclease